MANPNEPTPGVNPGIIIDSDWKAQAQAEKERLAAQDAARKPATKGAPVGVTGAGAPERAAAGEHARHDAASGAPPEDDRLPPADFRTLTGSLATQALMYMGGIADPETGRAIVALDYAKHYIDLLGVLDQKTKGNLTPEEAGELTEILGELRTRFVQITEAVIRSEERRLREESAARLRGPAAPSGADPFLGAST